MRKQANSISAYEKVMQKHQQSSQGPISSSSRIYQTDIKKTNENLTPSKQKKYGVNISPDSQNGEEEIKSCSYTDQEVSKYLSCIIQLKDHINYLNILMDNIIDALDRFRIDFNTKLNEYKSGLPNGEKIDNDRFEYDMRIKAVLKVIDEALYKNTDAITQFANITGHDTSRPVALIKQKMKHTQPAKMQSETKFNMSNTKKFSQIYDENVASDEEFQEFDKSVKASMDELKILKQENKYLKSELKKFKTQKEDLKVKSEEFDTDLNEISNMRKRYEQKITDLEREKNSLSENYDKIFTELYFY